MITLGSISGADTATVAKAIEFLHVLAIDKDAVARALQELRERMEEAESAKREAEGLIAAANEQLRAAEIKMAEANGLKSEIDSAWATLTSEEERVAHERKLVESRFAALREAEAEMHRRATELDERETELNRIAADLEKRKSTIEAWATAREKEFEEERAKIERAKEDLSARVNRIKEMVGS